MVRSPPALNFWRGDNEGDCDYVFNLSFVWKETSRRDQGPVNATDSLHTPLFILLSFGRAFGSAVLLKSWLNDANCWIKIIIFGAAGLVCCRSRSNWAGAHCNAYFAKLKKFSNCNTRKCPPPFKAGTLFLNWTIFQLNNMWKGNEERRHHQSSTPWFKSAMRTLFTVRHFIKWKKKTVADALGCKIAGLVTRI